MLAFGVDMLWYPVGFAAGYFVLLLVAAPLRRSGAYTLPDFAEVRLRLAAGPHGTAALVVGDRLALPGAAAPGRRADARPRHRRAGSAACSSPWS